MLVSAEGGKLGNPEKTLGARREPTTNSTQLDVWHRAGIELGPDWWEASALSYHSAIPATTDIQVPCRICLLANTMIILNDALKIKFCPQLSRAKLVVVFSEAFS